MIWNSELEYNNQDYLKSLYEKKVSGECPDLAVRKIYCKGCGRLFYTQIETKKYCLYSLCGNRGYQKELKWRRMYERKDRMVEHGLCTNPKIVKIVTDLSERLKTVKGKKQYGYLPKSVKAMVDSIVDELAEAERIKRLYDLWYECKRLFAEDYKINLHFVLHQELAEDIDCGL